MEKVPSSDAKTRVYGLPAQIERIASGYRLRLSAPQGALVELGIVLPRGQALHNVQARQAPTVPMFTFPAEAKFNVLDHADPQ